VDIESLIKSKSRVKRHGEVFTPKWMVHKMLDIPEISAACNNIYTTFLEPSAGDGNFLQEILKRKLDVVVENSHISNWKIKSLWALSSIYGVEYLADNLEVARARMFLYYLDWFETCFDKKLSPKTDLYKSAYYIIHKNIVRGNSLEQIHPEYHWPIMFLEWRRVKGYPSQVEIIPFALGSEGGKLVKFNQYIPEGQGSLFEGELELSIEQCNIIMNISKVYQVEGKLWNRILSF
jgi:type III restriction system methylase